jgi:trehalose synthase
MLQTVDVGERSLASYEGVSPEAILEELRATAAGLRGVRVAHVNATPYGGGVSELLRSTVPLYNDLGLIADWKIITGDNAFFEVTKKIHNGLQGAVDSLTPEEEQLYESTARVNAAALTEEYDLVFIHDPQPAAVLPFHGKGNARWIWRCHIDTGQWWRAMPMAASTFPVRAAASSAKTARVVGSDVICMCSSNPRARACASLLK